MRPTLLYSAGCPVCRWAVRNIVDKLDRDRVIDLVPFRSFYGRILLASHGMKDIEVIKQHWWWLEDCPDGSCTLLYQGNEGGFKRLLLHLTGVRHLVRFIPSSWLDRLDDFINRNRPVIAQFIEDGPAIRRIGKISEEVEWRENV